MSAEDFARARRALLRRDAILAPVIRKYKHRTILETPAIDPFSALVRTITSQQLSTKAAATIHRRILDLMPGGVATPESIEKTTDEQLRAAGLSRQKIAYVRDLAKHASTGDLPLHDLKTLSDDDVIAAITRVKGLGRWSAEMFLMFRLHRADVLPVDDLGIVVAVAPVSYRCVLVSLAEPGEHRGLNDETTVSHCLGRRLSAGDADCAAHRTTREEMGRQRRLRADDERVVRYR
jgi:DNA-3-methyladenine glycosylase II